MSQVTANQVTQHRVSGTWRTLEALALRIVASASEKAGQPFQPVMGGGTRLMLALNHRISDDIDLFHHDTQWIGYLTPRKNDQVDALTSVYEEASDFLKLSFQQGEIDFIMAAPLLNDAIEHESDVAFPLMPVEEVLAKKLFHRGQRLTPRDLFDWHAIETLRPDIIRPVRMGELLRSRAEGIRAALAQIGQSQYARQGWLAIQTPVKLDFQEVVAWGQECLATYMDAARRLPEKP